MMQGVRCFDASKNRSSSAPLDVPSCKWPPDRLTRPGTTLAFVAAVRGEQQHLLRRASNLVIICSHCRGSRIVHAEICDASPRAPQKNTNITTALFLWPRVGFVGVSHAR
jgi:hypothetical protein